MRRWGVIVPPLGAARDVMLSTVRAFERFFNESVSAVDTKLYQDGYRTLFKDGVEDDLVTDSIGQMLVCKVVEEEWDFILIGALSPVKNWTLTLLRKLGIRIIFWLYEDYRIVGYWREQLDNYDLFCSVQKANLKFVAGVKFRYLPTAIDSLPRITLSAEKKYDVAFIGFPTRYRTEMLRMLIDGGVNVAIAGSGWENVYGFSENVVSKGWVGEDFASKLYSISKIGLNLSQSDPFVGDGVELSQVSPRIYQMAASATVVCSEDLSLLEELKPELDFFTFSSEDELLSVTRMLISKEFSEEFYSKNINCIARKHTYKNRIEKLLNWLPSKD